MKRIALIISVIIVVLFAGCQKQLQNFEVVNENKTNIYNFNFKIENEMLVFETEQDLVNTLKYLSQMNFNEYTNWAKEHNFASLHLIFQNSLNLQAKLNEENDKNKNFITNDYCIEMQKNIDKEIIGINKNKEFEDYYLKTCRIELSLLLNENKMLCVNGDIYQYNENNIKIVRNKNFSKINQLENISKSTENGDIIVWEQNNEEKSGVSADTIYINHIKYAYGNRDKRTIDVFLRAFSRQITYNGPYYLSFYTQMQHYKNGSINICRELGLLKNTNYIVSKTLKENGVENEKILQNNLFQSNETNTETSTFTKYFLNGSYPENNIPSLVHFPHIKTGLIYYYVRDTYWLLGTQTVSFSHIYEVPEVYMRR